MIKELKFTPENLQMHLKAPAYKIGRIYTTRDEIKGNLGDIFKIDGLGFFVLIFCGTAQYYDWFVEGFKSRDDYTRELNRIYGTNDKLYMHGLLKLNDAQLKEMMSE